MENGIKVPIIFSGLTKHSDVAGTRNVVSAGFVSIFVNKDNNVQFNAYGHSVSLNLSSQPEDSTIINQLLLCI